jgi:hypothetical protein
MKNIFTIRLSYDFRDNSFRLGVQVDSYVCCTENTKLYFCARHVGTHFAPRFGLSQIGTYLAEHKAQISNK